SGRGFGSTEFHVVRTRVGVHPNYLFHFVLQRSFRASAARNMTGTAGQLRVPAAYLRNHRLPLPPRAEQKRIVAAIEEHLSRLDAAQESLRRAERKLALLRSSIVEALTSGDWD